MTVINALYVKEKRKIKYKRGREKERKWKGRQGEGKGGRSGGGEGGKKDGGGKNILRDRLRNINNVYRNDAAENDSLFTQNSQHRERAFTT